MTLTQITMILFIIACLFIPFELYIIYRIIKDVYLNWVNNRNKSFNKYKNKKNLK